MVSGWLRLATAIGLTLTLHAAWAHGDREARHGGLLSVGGEISFELVAHANQLVVHVDDHGEPVKVQGAVGTLEVRRAGVAVRTVDVKAAGEHSLGAPAVDLRKGDQVLLRAQLGSGTLLNGRFAIP